MQKSKNNRSRDRRTVSTAFRPASAFTSDHSFDERQLKYRSSRRLKSLFGAASLCSKLSRLQIACYPAIIMDRRLQVCRYCQVLSHRAARAADRLGQKKTNVLPFHRSNRIWILTSIRGLFVKGNLFTAIISPKLESY